jgi:hypothetical protein
MAMEHELYATHDDEMPRQRHALMTWPALLAIGWLIYEVTSQPNLGAAIICAKFGWNDFRTALWLRGADPVRRRARACFWFYLASGLWKMAITATLAIFAFAFLAASQHHGQQPKQQAAGLPPWFGGVLLTALMGFGLSAFTTLVSLWLAHRHGIKFWLSSSMHRFRRRNTWPPYEFNMLTPNQAGRVLLTALILVIAPVTITICVALGAAIGKLGSLAIMAIFLLGLCICPVTILVLRDMMDCRFVARTPWECWGTEEVSGE